MSTRSTSTTVSWRSSSSRPSCPSKNQPNPKSKHEHDHQLHIYIFIYIYTHLYCIDRHTSNLLSWLSSYCIFIMKHTKNIDIILSFASIIAYLLLAHVHACSCSNGPTLPLSDCRLSSCFLVCVANTDCNSYSECFCSMHSAQGMVPCVSVSASVIVGIVIGYYRITDTIGTVTGC